MINRLTFVTMSMAATVLCVGGLAYWVITLVERQAVLMQAQTIQTMTYAAEINADQAEAYARTLLAIQSPSPAKRDEYFAQVENYSRKVTDRLRNYRAATGTDDLPSLKLLDAVVETRSRYIAVRSEVFHLLDQHQVAAAQQLADGKLLPAYQAYTIAGDSLFAHQVVLSEERIRETHWHVERIKYAAVGLCVLVFLAGVAAPYVYLAGLMKWLAGYESSDQTY